MQKVIKIFFNLSYIVSLSALVFLGGVINKVTDRGNPQKDGKTVLGNDLSLNFASAEVPTSGDGYTSDGGEGDCDGDDDDDC